MRRYIKSLFILSVILKYIYILKYRAIALILSNILEACLYLFLCT